MRQLTFDYLKNYFSGKTVAIVGSAPTVLDNIRADIEGYDEIIRINNYKTKGIDPLRNRPYDYTANVGNRTDWHYSFYGSSIRKTQEELKADRIKGHLCKCPDNNCHMTAWHEKMGWQKGCDFRWIYRVRQNYWVAPVYIPEREHYLKCFNLLNKHVPTTGFCCVWEFINIKPKRLYITGFDFFESGKHNIDDMWRPGRADDPICHVPRVEYKYVKGWALQYEWIRVDKYLRGKFFGEGK